jgi:sec-independent protein translocase protein TatA
MGIGWRELLIILIIAVVIFGTAKLKNMGKDLGEGIKGFKKGMKDDDAPKVGQDESKKE